eukprot:scaffold71811_cov66-Phaeocystis_antarctica.AAC.5
MCSRRWIATGELTVRRLSSPEDSPRHKPTRAPSRRRPSCARPRHDRVSSGCWGRLVLDSASSAPRMLRSFVTVAERRDLNDRAPRFAPPGLYASTRARPTTTVSTPAVILQPISGGNLLKLSRRLLGFQERHSAARHWLGVGAADALERQKSSAESVTLHAFPLPHPQIASR